MRTDARIASYHIESGTLLLPLHSWQMTVADPQPSIWSQITGRGTAGVAQPGAGLLCESGKFGYFKNFRKALLACAGNRPDAHLFVIGPRGSGKSTLLNKYIQPDRVSYM